MTLDEVVAGVRELPSNLNSEMLVLGAALTDADALQQIVDVLNPADFYLHKHQVIYATVLDLFHSGQDVDTHTVASKLHREGHLTDVGGLSYLVGLECPRLVSLGTYIGHVRESAIIRQGIQNCTDLLSNLLCYKQDSGEMLATAEKLVNTLSTTKDQRERPRTITDVVQDSGGIEEFLKPREHGIRIPFRILDKTLMGLQRRRIVFCTARPGIGKTALLQQIAESAAAQDFRALVISAEMDAGDIVKRSICGRAAVSMYGFSEGHLKEHETAQLASQLGSLAALDDQLLFDDAPSISLRRMAAMLRYQVSIGKPVDLLLIDYVQLIESEPGSENRTQELAKLSRGLVRLKKQFNIAIFVLAQISREGAKELEPESHHMKECGQFEQDADSVLILWLHKKEQEAESLDPTRSVVTINWKIDKNRNGMRNRGGWNSKGESKNGLVFWKKRARFQEDWGVIQEGQAA